MRMVAMADLQTAHTAELDAATLTAARALLYDVFNDMTDHDWGRPNLNELVRGLV